MSSLIGRFGEMFGLAVTGVELSQWDKVYHKPVYIYLPLPRTTLHGQSHFW